MVKKEISKSLSACLTLPKILSKTLGFENTDEIIETFKENNLEDYKFDSDSSNLMQFLKTYQSSVKEPFNILNESKLSEYDLNIKEHIEKILSKREIRLKSFQYLSLLFTEIYFDYYFKCINNKDLDEIQNFLNNSLNYIIKYTEIEEYTNEDLQKICYWMATGSGKTIIMHINYQQYLFYSNKCNQEINNIILITPNEDLSKQHKKEFEKSDIKSMIISKKNYNIKTNLVKIIDINKIREKSGPETISYKAFGKNNLILVDEGHRGSSGETWMKYRNDIATEGFTMEYSATFQNTKKENDYISDYKKTILYDYSYKYYHEDGYGKDYEISNTNQTDNDKHIIMLANLLSFYEQKKIFLTYRKEAETEFNIEEPLWILVGSKVIDKKQDKLDATTESDISKFINFLNNLKIKKDFYKSELQKIIEDKTNLKYKETGESFFKNKFSYVKELIKDQFENDYTKLFEDIFKLVLYTKNDESKLILEDIKGSDGEIGLKYSGNKTFGLIYVGVGNDKKIIKSAKEKGILTSEQKMKESLFKTLNQTEKNPLNLLIGAKKFIEGWDNYRISSMLLMNFAKSKGVSAIQLFGRGVRLHGYQNSMKRSSAIHPPIQDKTLKQHLHLMETLNIFGIKAKYMDEFRSELEEDVEFYIEKEILVKQDPFNLIKHDLKCIREDEDTLISFKEKKLVDILNPIYIKSIQIDLNNHIQAISSFRKKGQQIDSSIPKDKIINTTFFNIVDWQKIIYEIRRYKRNNEYRNLCIPPIEEIKKLLKNLNLEIKGDENCIIDKFTNYEEYINTKQTLERVYLEILKKHIKKNYSINLRRHYEKKLKVVTINKNKDLIDRYKIKIFVDKKGNKTLDSNTEKFLEILEKEEAHLIDIYSLNEKCKKNLIDMNRFIIEFDRHLYKPLLISSNQGDYSLNPQGLNPGEKQFVEKLKKYFKDNQEKFKGKEIILLRNHENIGFGFFLETEKYYPDFIMWIIEGDKQKIMFTDPKGLAHLDESNMEKINFSERIKSIEDEIHKKYPSENIELYANIVTETNKSNIPNEEIRNNPEKKGVFFIDDHNFLDSIFKTIGI